MAAQWYETFAPATSGGILPNESTAQAMCYKKAIFWQVDLLGLGIAGVQKKGEWTVTITNSDESQLFFKQTVGLVLMLIKLGAAGLQLFTWNYVKDTFSTSFVAGTATTPANIGQFLQGGTAQSEQGDMRPASGYESTDLTATITADWYSPIYVFNAGQQLPPGYKVKISRDTWGIGTANSTYSWAFEEGVAGLGTNFDPFGALVSARLAADGDRIFTGRAWPGNEYRFLERGGAVKGSEPTLFELEDGRQILTVKTSEGVIELVSQDSEWTWGRMQYPNPDTGTETPQAIFGSDAQMPTSILLDNNARLHVAKAGASLFSRLVDEEGLGEKVFVGAAGNGGFSVEQDSNGDLLIIGEEGLPIYKSESIPPAWVPIAKVVQGVTA